MTTNEETLVSELKLSLGDQMIDVELDPEHFYLAITRAVDRYRQRSGNAMEECSVFLTTSSETQTYTLANEIQIVHYVWRRGLGGNAGGASLDPFSSAFTNNLYNMMSSPGSSGGGFLASYDAAMSYQETAGKLFGREVMFSWNQHSKKLTLLRKFSAKEVILLQCFASKPKEVIIGDVFSKPWIRDASLAYAKIMIGEARSKFSQIAGPQGGSQLNGADMKREGQEDLVRLDLELRNLVDGGGGLGGYGFTVG